jgi:hypothetical protein
MNYSDVARRIKRIKSATTGNAQAKNNLIASLKNQCRLAEGESALKELERECASSNSIFSGAGNKQTGFGSGKRLGDGRWKYDKGTWIQVS